MKFLKKEPIEYIAWTHPHRWQGEGLRWAAQAEPLFQAGLRFRDWGTDLRMHLVERERERETGVAGLRFRTVGAGIGGGGIEGIGRGVRGCCLQV